MKPVFATLSAFQMEGDELPKEFRIFRAGLNEAEDGGSFTFDALAAALVMRKYRERGIDIMIDLAHDYFNDAARAQRDDADDARGWCKLALRDGELWAVDVTWTPDGERRLRERTQRYFSPAILRNRKTGRVVELINVALCSMPRMSQITPLVARRNPEIYSMDPNQIKAALEALIAGDAEKCMEILKAFVASAASGGAPPASDPMGGDPGETTEARELATAARSFTGRTAKLEVLAELNRLRTELDSFTAQRVADEAAARAELVGDLVKLGFELPATAWENASKGIPVKRLRDEPLSDLRSRVNQMRQLRAVAPVAPSAPAPVPPVSGNADSLTPEEEVLAARMTPAQRAEFTAIRLARRAK